MEDIPTVPNKFMVVAFSVMFPPPRVFVEFAATVVVIFAVPSRFRMGVLIVMLPGLPLLDKAEEEMVEPSMKRELPE